MPRKKWTGGSQNLQRILKMKDKLREKNKSVIKKTKERFQYRNEEPLKLEMEGIKMYVSVSRSGWGVLGEKGVEKEILKFRYFMIALKRINNTH